MSWGPSGDGRIGSTHSHPSAVCVLKFAWSTRTPLIKTSHTFYTSRGSRKSISFQSSWRDLGRDLTEKRVWCNCHSPCKKLTPCFNDKGLHKDKIHFFKKEIFLIAVWISKNKRIWGWLRTEPAERLCLYWESHQVPSWNVSPGAPILAVPGVCSTDWAQSWTPSFPPEPSWEHGHHSSRQQNYRKQQNMSQKIHMFLNILKTSIPSCFWVSRECNFKIHGLIWLSTKFAWGLVGRGRKPQEVDFSLGSQNKMQRQDFVMGGSAIT